MTMIATRQNRADDRLYRRELDGKEVLFFHRMLDWDTGFNEVIKLAGRVEVDYEERITTILYTNAYRNDPEAMPIDPFNYPLSESLFENRFKINSPYTGIPAPFIDDAVSDMTRKLARNSRIDSPRDAPRTPLQYLLNVISGDGLWYFSPTEELIRSKRTELTIDFNYDRQQIRKAI
ncbi:MAG: hypothetical protein ACJAS1_000856 [Oleiphilaceae bacterium]|jgi:hypothetical protein